MGRGEGEGGRSWDYHLEKFYCTVSSELLFRFAVKFSFRCTVWKLGGFFLLICLAQGQPGRGETGVCAGLVLESIEGVMLTLSSSGRDLEWQPDLITWRSLEGVLCDLQQERSCSSVLGETHKQKTSRKKWMRSSG